MYSEHTRVIRIASTLSRDTTYYGTIDEFIDDAILVIFGAPMQRDDDVHRTVARAVEMQRAMVANTHNRREGLPEVKMEIGVHTGEVVVGNIGSDTRAPHQRVIHLCNGFSRPHSILST